MTLQTIIICSITLINIGSFIAVGFDKSRSVSSEHRVPEVYFFFWSIFFSSPGILIGMFAFHHKTRKWIFLIGITAMVLQQLALVYLFLTRI